MLNSSEIKDKKYKVEIY